MIFCLFWCMWLKCLQIFLIIFPCKLFGPKLLVENILFISKRVYHNFGLRNHWLVESSWISSLKDHICPPKSIQNPWKWPPENIAPNSYLMFCSFLSKWNCCFHFLLMVMIVSFLTHFSACSCFISIVISEWILPSH